MNKVLNAAYTLLSSDNGNDFICNGSFAITIGSPSDFSRDFDVFIKNDGTGAVTLTGYISKTLSAGASCRLTNTGVKWGINDMDENITPELITANELKTDTITEKTSDSGVNVDGVLLKDGSAIASTDIQLKAILSDFRQGILKLKHARNTHIIEGGQQTETITMAVPANCKVIGALLNNDTEIIGFDSATEETPISSYAASYDGGLSQTINATMGVELNDKTNCFFDVNTDDDKTSDVTNILIDAGAGNVFESGTISAVIFYYQMENIEDIIEPEN